MMSEGVRTFSTIDNLIFQHVFEPPTPLPPLTMARAHVLNLELVQNPILAVVMGLFIEGCFKALQRNPFFAPKGGL